jgi:hypothetical protein
MVLQMLLNINSFFFFLASIVEDASELARYLALMSDPFVERNIDLVRSWREGCILFMGALLEEDVEMTKNLRKKTGVIYLI